MPNDNLNGLSGKALDDLFLSPLGLDRNNTWLCDLLPESRLNPGQKKAIERQYQTLIDSYNLPVPTIPEFSKKELNSAKRRNEILRELKQSQAEILILLGDEPIKWFLNHFDKRFSKLADFGNSPDDYGQKHTIEIDKTIYQVIPLCHPRQAGRLGVSSSKWRNLHEMWVKRQKEQSVNNNLF